MNLEKKLVEAAERGDTSGVSFLIQREGVQVDAVWNGQTALITAALGKHVDCLSTLLDLGADVDVVGETGITALGHVIRLGHVPCILPLLRASAISDFQRRFHYMKWSWRSRFIHGLRNAAFPSVGTMLMDFCRQQAPQENCLNLIMFLFLAHGCPVPSLNRVLELGAHTNATYRYGLTPLIVTAAAGMSEQINMLLEKGADENMYDDICRLTPLHYAAKIGNQKSLELLLRNGARTSDLDCKGRNALMHAAESGSEECVSLLVRKGYSVAYISNSGMTALMYSACSGNVMCIERLISEGSQLSEEDKEGKSSLIYAAEKGKLECLAFLLSKGCKADDQDTWEKSALMFAVEHGHLGCANLLLRSGASVHHVEGSGKNALHFAAETGHAACLRLLLKSACNVNITDSMGVTALMLASLSGSVECVELILDAGGTANCSDTMAGRTAVMYAARKGSSRCMTLLLKAGANCIDADNFGRTVLMYAAEGGSVECINIVLQNDSRVDKVYRVNECSLEKPSDKVSVRSYIDVVDFRGMTALMLAIRQGETGAVKRLLEAGADHSVMSVSGENALSTAIYTDKVDCVECILQAGDAKTKSSHESPECLRVAIKIASNLVLDKLVHGGVFHWDWFDKADFEFVKSVYPLLIEAGIPPGEFKANGSVVTLLGFSLLHQDLDMAMHLLNTVYLSPKDLISQAQDVNFQSAHWLLQTVQGQGMARYPGLSWPLTLQTHSLVTISEAINETSCQSGARNQHIHTLPLPPVLKRKLQYENGCTQTLT